jgi:hypothetical protein
MVLVQIYLNASTNGSGNNVSGSYYTIPVTGKACVRVLGVQYHDSGTTNRVLQLQSDNLYFAYSQQRYLTWMCMPTSITQANVCIDMSRDAYHIKDQQFNGQLFLKIVQTFSQDGTTLPASFNAIVSLDFEFIDMEFK